MNGFKIFCIDFRPMSHTEKIRKYLLSKRWLYFVDIIFFLEKGTAAVDTYPKKPSIVYDPTSIAL